MSGEEIQRPADKRSEIIIFMCDERSERKLSLTHHIPRLFWNNQMLRMRESGATERP